MDKIGESVTKNLPSIISGIMKIISVLKTVGRFIIDNVVPIFVKGFNFISDLIMNKIPAAIDSVVANPVFQKLMTLATTIFTVVKSIISSIGSVMHSIAVAIDEVWTANPKLQQFVLSIVDLISKVAKLFGAIGRVVRVLSVAVIEPLKALFKSKFGQFMAYSVIEPIRISIVMLTTFIEKISDLLGIVGKIEAKAK